jgi:phosphoglycolate phosphatase
VKLVLFDIDGTLILSGRAGLRGMSVAFQKLYDAPNALDHVPFAGRTDRAIVSDALSGLRRAPTETEILKLRDAYLEELPVEMPRPAGEPSCVLPGVEALLEALAGRRDVTVGLLTGNFAGGAAIKLGYFDLWRRFAFGAFGDHHLHRRDLFPVAMDTARQHGLPVLSADQVIIVGDTPLDVDCGRAHGARVIAVATGHYDSDALRATDADLVVDSLSATADILEWVG